MNDRNPYATPRRGVLLQECAFYHRLDIPGVDTFQWDLVGDEAAYLGNFEFSGKRVLEFGAASGALTFWMEKQGAEVVGMDLSPDVDNTSWDVLRPTGEDVDLARQRMAAGNARLNNGFWYAHEFFGSRALGARNRV
ncbi:MAG: class I SAM-dependent methyltransferase [Gammaproteobacteria bacterium]